MPVEKMTMVTLSGPESRLDEALCALVADRDVHMENIFTLAHSSHRYRSFEGENPYAQPLQKTCAMMAELDVKPERVPFGQGDYDAAGCLSYAAGLEKQLADMKSELDAGRATAENEARLRAQLRYLSGINEDLSSLLNVKYVKFRYGRIVTEDYDELLERIRQMKGAFYIRTGEGEGYTYGLCFAIPSVADDVDALCDGYGFERIRIQKDSRFKGTPDEEMAALAAAGERWLLREKELTDAREALKAGAAAELLPRYCWLRFMNGAFELRARAGARHGKFCAVLWLPSAAAAAYRQECESRGFGCVLADESGQRLYEPPVRLGERGFFLSRVFTPFLAMYGMPRQDELDPRAFLALSYTLLFGIMFGDVGQGACLLIAGLLLYRRTKAPLCRIIACLGVPSMIFGLIYNSVFGYETLLPWEGYKAMGDGNMITTLFVAVGIGAGLIIVCMVLNIINGIRQRDIKMAVFSANGLVGGVFYVGLAFGLVASLLFGLNVFTPVYIIFVIVLPLVIIMLSDPLSRLCEGRKDWKTESIGMIFINGFFEVFESLLSYMSNTVSFLRVGAFAVSHAGMMMVVFMLAKTAAGGNNPIVIVFGNIVVMVLESVLACIQILRLEYYELLGRFYTSGSVPFTPQRICYEKLP